MKDTILLTGATGFIGRRVLKLLLQCDINILVIARKQSLEYLPELRSNDKIILTDNMFAESESWWTHACSNVDMVLHLAWFAEHSSYLYSSKNQECLHGSIRMSVGALKAKVKKIVGIGTCLEYQISNHRLNVETPLDPRSLYAKSKAEYYYFLREYSERYKFIFSWCRLFFIYGEDEPITKLHSHIRKELLAGRSAVLEYAEAKRDYLHVDHVAKAIKDIAFGEPGGVFNICSGNAIKLKDVAFQIADEIGIDRSKIVVGKSIHEFQEIVGVPNF